jgi:hypothetical protein
VTDDQASWRVTAPRDPIAIRDVMVGVTSPADGVVWVRPHVQSYPDSVRRQHLP